MRKIARTLARTVKPLFLHNAGLKLLALGCAVALYTFVHGAQDAQKTMLVELVVLPPPTSNRILTTELPTTVRVSLHGPRSIVADLRPSDIGGLQLDLRSGRSGLIPLGKEMLSVPGGVKVDSIDPPALQISWDDLVERDITVQIPVTGQPADGFMVKGTPTANPSMLRARGPRQLVDTLQYARTEAFDVTGLAEGIHRRSLAVATSPTHVSYDLTSTLGTVEVSRRLLERVFSKVTVQIVGSARAAAVPAHVDVRVVGPPDLVKSLRPEQVVPRVDLKTEGVNLAKPDSVALPVGVEIDNVTSYVIPKTVVVKW